MGTIPRNRVDKMGIKTVNELGIDEMDSYRFLIQHSMCRFSNDNSECNAIL